MENHSNFLSKKGAPIISTECIICCEEYDLKTRKPMILDCGHTICNFCLQAIFTSSRKCPLDKTPFRKGLEHFSVNFIYSEIISELRPKELNELQGYKECVTSIGKYFGQMKKNQIEGRGKMIYSNGSVYEGEWHNGKRNGRGKIINPDYSEYEGDWSEDQPHGIGSMQYPEGPIKSYSGGWRNGKFFGLGKIEYRNNETFESVFVNNETVSPIVKFQRQDNLVFGLFEMNQFRGQIAEISFSGDVYIGELDSDKLRTGQGKLYLKNSDYYEGEFLSGKYSGKGRLIFAIGDIYEGQFSNGMMNGEGYYSFIEGGNYGGNWLNNKRHGTGVQTNKDGDIYRGNWENDLLNGYGKIIKKNGYYFEGNFKFGKKEGRGMEAFPNGETYEGFFSNDLKNGSGLYSYKNGDKCSGMWKDDVLHGEATIMTSNMVNNKRVDEAKKVKFINGKLEDGKNNKNCIIF